VVIDAMVLKAATLTDLSRKRALVHDPLPAAAGLSAGQPGLMASG
jgi:hypothetical protein